MLLYDHNLQQVPLSTKIPCAVHLCMHPLYAVHISKHRRQSFRRAVIQCHLLQLVEYGSAIALGNHNLTGIP
jgi:hypothetical protein